MAEDKSFFITGKCLKCKISANPGCDFFHAPQKYLREPIPEGIVACLEFTSDKKIIIRVISCNRNQLNA